MEIGGSVHTVQGWQGQFERMTRWAKRVETISAERQQKGDLHSQQDYIYAFFQNCYHLRDWLLKSRVVAKTDLDDLFRQHVELQICRDVCNGTKHMEIDRASVDAHFSIYRE